MCVINYDFMYRMINILLSVFFFFHTNNIIVKIQIHVYIMHSTGDHQFKYIICPYIMCTGCMMCSLFYAIMLHACLEITTH